MGFVANFMRFAAVQKFWKSIKIWQNHREFKGGTFFETKCSSVLYWLMCNEYVLLSVCSWHRTVLHNSGHLIVSILCCGVGDWLSFSLLCLWLCAVSQLWTARRVYYFAGENIEVVDRWVKGLLKLASFMQQHLSHKMMILRIR